LQNARHRGVLGWLSFEEFTDEATSVVTCCTWERTKKPAEQYDSSGVNVCSTASASIRGLVLREQTGLSLTTLYGPPPIRMQPSPYTLGDSGSVSTSLTVNSRKPEAKTMPPEARALPTEFEVAER
jgi:hypothetical protein